MRRLLGLTKKIILLSLLVSVFGFGRLIQKIERIIHPSSADTNYVQAQCWTVPAASSSGDGGDGGDGGSSSASGCASCTGCSTSGCASGDGGGSPGSGDGGGYG